MRIVRLEPLEGAAPSPLHGPSEVLARLRTGTEVREVRGQDTLEVTLPVSDDLLEAVVPAFLAQPVELVVGVEHEGRPREAAREAGARRVQPDDEEGRPGEAEGERRVFGIGAHGRVPTVVAPVLLVQALELLPEQPFKGFLIETRWCLEARDEAGKLAAQVLLLAHEVEEVAREDRGRPRRAHLRVEVEVAASAPDRRLCPHAGEVGFRTSALKESWANSWSGAVGLPRGARTSFLPRSTARELLAWANSPSKGFDCRGTPPLRSAVISDLFRGSFRSTRVQGAVFAVRGLEGTNVLIPSSLALG